MSTNDTIVYAFDAPSVPSHKITGMPDFTAFPSKDTFSLFAVIDVGYHSSVNKAEGEWAEPYVLSRLIAGSGTLTTIMSLKANFEDVNILVGILINCVVIYLVLVSLKWIEKALGPSGLAVIRKFFGVILLAIAVKIFGSNIVKFGH
jgi:hypothetical protein